MPPDRSIDEGVNSEMSTSYSGTNTEKIEQLVVTAIEFRTTLRICFAVIGFGFPLMIGLLTFLVVQSFATSAKIDRLSDQVVLLRDNDASLSTSNWIGSNVGPPVIGKRRFV